jgi:small neutral amino acid transporter SnatA (MarC family)
MDAIEKKARLKANLINNALGFFILLFGFVVFFSMSLSETRIQMMTNIVAGGSLILIGGGMMWYAKRTIKKYDLKGLKDGTQ